MATNLDRGSLVRDTEVYRAHAAGRFPADEWERRTCELLVIAADEIDRLNEKRLEQDRKIHNQRVALRSNWEIIEMRAQYAKAWYPSKLLTALLKRGHKVLPKEETSVSGDAS